MATRSYEDIYRKSVRPGQIGVVSSLYDRIADLPDFLVVAAAVLVQQAAGADHEHLSAAPLSNAGRTKEGKP